MQGINHLSKFNIMSLLKETLRVLESNGKTPQDVKWVGTEDTSGTWDQFAENADFDYDSGYGSAEVAEDLKVVGKDWWLERGEYDGSEWWAFKTLPTKPEGGKPLGKLTNY